MNDGFKTFLANYNYAGRNWCIDFPAESFEDAEARLKAMTWGKIDGILMAEIPVSPVTSTAGGLIVRLICWAKNAFSQIL